MVGALVGVGGAALLGAVGYQSMAPTGQWYGRTFIGLPRGSKQIALTYDDGPNDPHTLRLLEVLARHDVPATFFFIGRYVQRRPQVVRDVARARHAIGNHTFTHPHLVVSRVIETRNQLEECQRALEDAAGEVPRLFRPPFGGRRPVTLRIARSLGLEPVLWNVTGWDWKNPPAEKIVENCVRQIRGGDVILLHDGSHRALGADRSQTVVATERLIERYKSEGYEFVTIPQMMANLEVSGQPSALGHLGEDL
jgi:peptidoglycan/xylan/chitin deacetylase (PgdA/CDA1 family)